MARQDILSLSTEDLVSLSNAGLVKRAQRELEAGELKYELEESENGLLTFRWSDGIQCILPPGQIISAGVCNCLAVGVCRHLLRSALAYQQHTRQQTESEVIQPWDPGLISDELIAQHFSKAVITRARRLFEEGQVLELVRSLKPSAHLHTQACTVRFLVKDNPAYTRCDCREEAPCTHALLAILAFRLLPAGKSGGLVSTRPEALPVPAALLDELEMRLGELMRLGISGIPQSLFDHFRRLETRCRQEELVWPAEIINDLLQQIERYKAHDSRFAPELVAQLCAELVIRADAIRQDTGAVPPLFVRGSKNDGTLEIGSARLVGLGCGGRVNRKSYELCSYMQDQDTGILVGVRTEIAIPEDNEPRPSFQMAQASAGKGLSFAGLGSGQLLVKGAKRTPAYQLMLGRQQAAMNPQTYKWENLRAPLLVEDFTELRAHLNTQPPSCLRPRHITGDFYVCPVSRAEGVHFSAVSQVVMAQLYDITQQSAWLVHPFTTWAAEGSERLLQTLDRESENLKFIAGHARQTGEGLVFEPVSLVFEREGRRFMVQPWIDRLQASEKETSGESGNISPQFLTGSGSPDLFQSYSSQLLAGLGELFLLGLERAGPQLSRLFRHLEKQGESIGFERLVKPVAHLANELESSETRLEQDYSGAISSALEIGVLARMCLEI